MDLAAAARQKALRPPKHELGPRALAGCGVFALQVLKAFRANQGLLLAGAVAYYALLSLVPLLILMLIALSHLLDESRLLATLSEYLQFIVPGQGEAVVGELRAFLQHRDGVGGALLVAMIFFSSLAFTVLENAMSVIFFHRVAVRRRHFIVSALLPYCFILFLALGLLLVTIVSGKLAILATRDVILFGVPRSLDELSGYLLYDNLAGPGRLRILCHGDRRVAERRNRRDRAAAGRAGHRGVRATRSWRPGDSAAPHEAGRRERIAPIANALSVESSIRAACRLQGRMSPADRSADRHAHRRGGAHAPLPRRCTASPSCPSRASPHPSSA